MNEHQARHMELCSRIQKLAPLAKRSSEPALHGHYYDEQSEQWYQVWHIAEYKQGTDLLWQRLYEIKQRIAPDEPVKGNADELLRFATDDKTRRTLRKLGDYVLAMQATERDQISIWLQVWSALEELAQNEWSIINDPQTHVDEQSGRVIYATENFMGRYLYYRALLLK